MILLAFTLKIAVDSSLDILQSRSMPLPILPTINLSSSVIPFPTLLPKNIHLLPEDLNPADFPI